MKFAVGYKLPSGHENFLEVLADYRNQVAEVYFAWVGMASGRAALGDEGGYINWAAQRHLEDDLVGIRRMGIKLDLLFNANCYGPHAISRRLEQTVRSVIDYLCDEIGGIDAVTTTSPAVAHVVKRHYPEITTRASINMRLENQQAMSYVTDLFDSFYLKREHNRDTARLARTAQWARANGKQLCILANSGCLAHCSSQTFHDNLVAHEQDADEIIPMDGFTPHLCWSHLSRPANWGSILRSSWIRPEDLHHYEPYAEIVKLATRMHNKPRMILDAYTRGKYPGNLLDLLEPGHGSALAPSIIDNSRFPTDWHDRVTTCRRECDLCAYCSDVLAQVLTTPEA